MLRRLFLFSLLTCVVGAFSSAEVVWFSNTSCGSQRHLSVPSFLLRSKTADLEDLPPAAPPAAGLADLPCVLSLNTDIVDLLYLLFLLCPNRPRGPGGCPPALPRLVAAWRSSWLRAVLGGPSCPGARRSSAFSKRAALDLSPLPAPARGNTCGALARGALWLPPVFLFGFEARKSQYRVFSGKSWGTSRPARGSRRSIVSERETKFVDDDDIYRRRQKKNNVGFPRPGRSQKQAQNRRMTRPCLSKKSAPLSTGAGFVPAVGP